MRLNIYLKQTLFVLLFVFATFLLKAQKNFFTKVTPRGKYKLESNLKSFVIYKLDQVAMKQYLAKSPLEFSNNNNSKPVVIAVPLPDGTIETFQIFESPILSADLAKQFPDIKTYTGKSKKNGTTIRISFTANGFDALITGAGKDAVYFQKASADGTDNSYISYLGSKVIKPAKPGTNSKCGTIGATKSAATDIAILGDTKGTFGIQNLTTTGTSLRSFKLAVSATAEYTNLKGAGNTTTAFNTIVAFVNRLVAVYRLELSVSFTLVSGTNLVFTTPGTPFTNNSSNALITQNQTTVDNIIGNANYDLAFVLGTSTPNSSSGGLAASSSVGVTGEKAQNATQVAVDNTFAPVFDDQTIAHEVGHQFSMSHSFNSSIPVCTTREPSTSVEVGSGTTIMSYGYTCSDNSGNDDYENTYLPFLNFHAVNYSQAVTFIATIPTVYTSTTSNNTPPAISSITADKIIPISTPFALTGTATDVNSSDVLTYSWEGTNIGTSTPVPATFANTTQPPFFRSYQPTNTATRYYPRLSAILNGTNAARGDKLPSIGIATTHRFTVRDNATGVNTGTVIVTVDGNSGPFLETTNLAGNYASGTQQTITWSVNNTTAAPVSCANVSILFSTDGGQTFPYTIAASTPNDGSEFITLPSLTTTTNTARIKVQAVDNIFFDISNVDFTVSATLPVTITNINAYKKGTGVSVEWSVLNEINVKKYELEKSGNGINFVKLGEVTAIKASNYTWLDVAPFTGANYYRVKSVDNDGSIQFSNIVVLKNGTNTSQNITVISNPTINNKIQLLVENTDKGLYNIALYNQLGQQITRKQILHNGNTTTYTIATNSIAKGIYQLVITDAKDFKVTKAVLVD